MTVSQLRILLLFASASIITSTVTPFLTDPFNIAKIAAATIFSSLFLWKYSDEIVKGPGKSLAVNLYFLLTLSLAILSGTDFYRGIFGTWGRNNGLNYLVFVLVMFIMGNLFLKESNIISFLRYFSHFGLLMSFLGYLQFLGLMKDLWENPGSPIVLTFGNENFTSAFLALTALATVWYSTNVTVIWKKFALWVSVFFQLFIIYLSTSVQGLVIFVFGVSIYATLYLYLKNKYIFSISLKIWIISTLCFGFVMILSLFGKGIRTPLSTQLGSLNSRYMHWLAAIDMFRANVLKGVGIDSFGEYFPRYRRLLSNGLPDTYTNNSHNALLQAFSTGGLLLGTAYIALNALVILNVYRRLRNKSFKSYEVAVVAIWISFTLQSLISIDQIGLSVWGWIFAGALVIDKESKFEKIKIFKLSEKLFLFKSKRAIQALSIMLAATLVPLFSSIIQIQGIRSYISNIVSASSTLDRDLAAKNLFDLALKYPEPAMRMQATGYLLKFGYVEAGLTLSKDSVRRFPESVWAWDAVASIYEQTGRKSLALKYRNRAAKLDPLNIEIHKRLLEDSQN